MAGHEATRQGGRASMVPRLGAWLRGSSVPYLAVLVTSVVLAPYMAYLVRDDVTIKGQPLNIAVELIAFPVAVALWALYRGRPTSSPLLRLILVLGAAAWAVRMVLVGVHGDAFNHLVWLTPVFLVMLALKTPSWQETRTAIVLLAYGLAAVLLSSYLLEVVGLYEPLYLPAEITAFQKEQYWLPLDGLPGIEGRWTGPLGHNTRAGLVAALVFVVGAARWSRVGIPLLLVGGFFLMATSVRASYLAAITGLAIVLLFSRRGLLGRVPTWPRWATLTLLFVIGGAVMTITGAGLTGRDTIWPAFARLIPTSPWIGIGATGIDAGEYRVMISGDAHNIVLDELVRFGLIGLVALLAFLGAMAVASFRAANSGFTLGAAILTTYLVASLTDVQNDWRQLGYHLVLVVLGAVAAAGWVHEQRRGVS